MSEQDWQKIETAPKDGSWVLTFGCLHDDGGVDMGECPKVQFSQYTKKTGWFCFDWGSHEPTHWMPLPKPPKD